MKRPRDKQENKRTKEQKKRKEIQTNEYSEKLIRISNEDQREEIKNNPSLRQYGMFVARTLSPALAFSTASPRKITSKDRGMLPGGISSAFSWTLSRCQSTNTLLWMVETATGRGGGREQHASSGIMRDNRRRTFKKRVWLGNPSLAGFRNREYETMLLRWNTVIRTKCGYKHRGIY